MILWFWSYNLRCFHFDNLEIANSHESYRSLAITQGLLVYLQFLDKEVKTHSSTSHFVSQVRAPALSLVTVVDLGLESRCPDS